MWMGRAPRRRIEKIERKRNAMTEAEIIETRWRRTVRRPGDTLGGKGIVAYDKVQHASRRNGWLRDAPLPFRGRPSSWRHRAGRLRHRMVSTWRWPAPASCAANSAVAVPSLRDKGRLLLGASRPLSRSRLDQVNARVAFMEAELRDGRRGDRAGRYLTAAIRHWKRREASDSS